MKRPPWLPLAIVATILVLIGVIYVQFGALLNIQSWADRESQLRSYQQTRPVLVALIAFAIYAMATGMSLPGAAVLTLAYGWYFDVAWGVLLVSFASTTGATLAFLTSRFLFRQTIEAKLGDKLKTFNENLRREGAFYLLTLRLIPAVPFFLINVGMGLTPLRTRTFWWVSQLGMLPGTVAYVYAGSTFPTLRAVADEGASSIWSWPLVVAFVLLGLLPWVGRWAVQRYRKRTENLSDLPPT